MVTDSRRMEAFKNHPDLELRKYFRGLNFGHFVPFCMDCIELESQPSEPCGVGHPASVSLSVRGGS